MPIIDEPNPYQSPLMNCETGLPPAGADGSYQFRFRFLSVWRFAMGVAFLGIGFFIAIPVMLAPLPISFPEKGIIIGLSFIAGVATETIFAWFVWYCFPIFVSSMGIRCQNGLGRYHFVEWKDVTSVRPTRFISLGMPYFRLYKADGNWPLWLSRYIANPNVFWPYVLSQLDDASPLAKAIREAELAE